MPRTLLYVAYPMRLDLGAANAIQTYNTVRELRAIVPDAQLVVPRWLREPSAFADLGALHLPRPAVNKLSRIVPWGGWSYVERTLYSFMLVVLLMLWRVRGRGYSAIYARDTVCAAWLCLARGLHSSRVIYEVHDLEADHPSRASRWPRGFWSRFLPWLDRVALRRSYRVVSLTTTFKEWLVAKGLRKTRDVAVIPDAFDPGLFYPVDKVDARRETMLPADAFIVGYAGLTFAYRGLETLIEAFAKISQREPNAVLALVGGRPAEVEALRSQAKELYIPEDQIVFTGQLPQARAVAYTQAADVLVIPDTVTMMTASPLKLFEYMAVGRPIVCKDMQALREIVTEEAALFIEGGDAGSLARALCSLMDDPARRERMGEAALRLSAEYTYAARAARIAEVLDGER